MTLILDGKKLSETIATRLKQNISLFKDKPTLVIIQIGDISASNIYIQRKTLFAKKIGANVILKKYETTVEQSKIIEDIHMYNNDPVLHGIIIQLPIPKSFDKDAIIESIRSDKDVDGLTSTNIKDTYANNGKGIVPATTRGILTLLDHYNISIAGKKVVMVGRSPLVGKPTVLAFVNRNATVTVCHSYTENIEGETKRADILIVAIGIAKYITEKHVSPGQIIIDIGINALDGDVTTGKRKISGDVDYQTVAPTVDAITPVPGGVGPMTVASLFENLFQQFIHHNTGADGNI
jgi:methylenetetrahydrofolate dehydrogenase (NADP+)/methenyltetrahydrofolate cyclohydrolase